MDKVPFLHFFQYLIAIYRKSRKARETIFGSLVAGLVHLLWSIYFADRWRCNFADRKTARKHVQGQVGALLSPASNTLAPSKLKFCPWCTSSKKVFISPYVTRLAAEKLRVELYKKKVTILRHSYGLW